MNYFNGSYEFLENVLIEFNIYEKKPSILEKYYGYSSFSSVRNCKRVGINQRVWHLLHLDLSILNAVNPKIKYKNLDQLKKKLDVIN